MSDPFSPRESEFGVTRRILRLLADYDYPAMISTKGIVPDDYWELLSPGRIALQVSLTTIDAEFATKHEPGAPTPLERLGVLRRAHEAGLWTSVRLQPIIDIGHSLRALRAALPFVRFVTCEHLKVANDNFAVRKFYAEQLGSGAFYQPIQGRQYEVKAFLKRQNIERIKEAAHGIPVGVGDNDLHDLSDTMNCCGVDVAGPRFSNWLKYNATFSLKGGDVGGEWSPMSDIRGSTMNEELLIPGLDKVSQYVDVFISQVKRGVRGNSPAANQTDLFHDTVEEIT